MPITTCTSCEKAFEAWSEESANEPVRECPDCRACREASTCRQEGPTNDMHSVVLKDYQIINELEQENALLLSALKWAMHHVENVFALSNPDDPEFPELLKARTIMNRAEKGNRGETALSSSGPCPYEAEVARIKQYQEDNDCGE